MKWGIAMLLYNVGSMVNSYLAYRCATEGHEGFAVAFLVLAFTSFCVIRAKN